uniref:riboflavin kinase n=1 Tax=Magallana gigas TaxID=29159 RepID=A0A8W8NWG4_MAGGI
MKYDCKMSTNYPESVVDNLPKDMPLGVYYGWGSVDDGEVYKMTLSVGWNLYYKNTKSLWSLSPFKNATKSMETYLMHTFNDDFYGPKLKVVMLGYIRPMKDFSYLDELVKAIENDIYVAKRKLNQTVNLKYKTNNFVSPSGEKGNEEADITKTDGPSLI